MGSSRSLTAGEETGMIVHIDFHLDRAYRLSSSWHYFSEECDRLKLAFSRLKYPDNLVNSTISRFVAARASDQPVSSPAVSDRVLKVRTLKVLKVRTSRVLKVRFLRVLKVRTLKVLKVRTLRVLKVRT